MVSRLIPLEERMSRLIHALLLAAVALNLANGRSALAEARSGKSNGAAETKLVGDANSIVDGYNALVRDGAAKYDRLSAMGEPSQSWSADRLSDYSRGMDQLIANVDERLTILKEHSSVFADSSGLASTLTSLRGVFVRLNDAVKDAIRAR